MNLLRRIPTCSIIRRRSQRSCPLHSDRQYFSGTGIIQSDSSGKYRRTFPANQSVEVPALRYPEYSVKSQICPPKRNICRCDLNLDKQFNEHATFKLCEDIALTLCKLFAVESEDTNLVTAIEKYIEKNFMDPSMGLNKISDEFQISESYFSHMFKEKTA